MAVNLDLWIQKACQSVVLFPGCALVVLGKYEPFAQRQLGRLGPSVVCEGALKYPNCPTLAQYVDYCLVCPQTRWTDPLKEWISYHFPWDDCLDLWPFYISTFVFHICWSQLFTHSSNFGGKVNWTHFLTKLSNLTLLPISTKMCQHVDDLSKNWGEQAIYIKGEKDQSQNM